jgi:hypothetical protein
MCLKKSKILLFSLAIKSFLLVPSWLGAYQIQYDPHKQPLSLEDKDRLVSDIINVQAQNYRKAGAPATDSGFLVTQFQTTELSKLLEEPETHLIVVVAEQEDVAFNAEKSTAVGQII